MEHQARLTMYRDRVEDMLECLFLDGSVPYAKLLDSMRYSLLAGGKRLRPALVLEFSRLCGADTERVFPVACGVEVLHTYSLIHDDLPCMDNDDLRRGKPTNHKVFGECTATLAGDALQASAFELILGAPLSEGARVRCGQMLAQAAGPKGICGGQQLDLEWEGRPLMEEELREIHLRKTAALIRACCQMGVAAGEGTEEQMQSAAEYADHLGLAFQIRDDILDVVSTTEKLGKPVGSDAVNQKTTYATLLGVRACDELVLRHTKLAKAALSHSQWHGNIEFLCWLADQLSGRSN